MQVVEGVPPPPLVPPLMETLGWDYSMFDNISSPLMCAIIGLPKLRLSAFPISRENIAHIGGFKKL